MPFTSLQNIYLGGNSTAPAQLVAMLAGREKEA